MSRQQTGEPGHPTSSQENITTNLDASALIDIELAPAPNGGNVRRDDVANGYAGSRKMWSGRVAVVALLRA
jgi:hypothetical protein